MALSTPGPVVHTVSGRPTLEILAELHEHTKEYDDQAAIMQVCYSLLGVASFVRVRQSWKNFRWVLPFWRPAAEVFSRPLGEAEELLTTEDIVRFFVLGEFGMEVMHLGNHSQQRVDRWFLAWHSVPILQPLWIAGVQHLGEKLLCNAAKIAEILGSGALLFLPRDWARCLAEIEPAHMDGVLLRLTSRSWRVFGYMVLRLMGQGISPMPLRFQYIAEEDIALSELDNLFELADGWEYF